MKRTLVLLIACLFVLSACSPNSTSSEVNLDPPQDVSAESEEEPAPEPAVEITQKPETEEEAEAVEDVGGIVEKFEIYNPYQAFSEEEMMALGAGDFSGTDQEIAQMIINWQNKNMHYIGDPNQQADISHPMRWNYFLPGIYPVSDMVQDRRMADGKIYGLCWDYASIFTAMASYYDLDVRVTAYKTLLSDLNPQFQKGAGMSEEEYAAILPRLSGHALVIDYNHISRSARETWTHYRAEVKIGEQWVAFDGAPGVSDEFAAQTYAVASWDEGYDANLLYGEVAFSNEGINIAVLAELLALAPVEGYGGIVDDAGNSNRAANMQDLVAGKGLVPYFKELEDIKAFLAFSDEDGSSTEDFDDLMVIKEDYEKETGKLFYVIADYLIFADDDVETADYVLYYNAFTGSEITAEEFDEFIK